MLESKAIGLTLLPMSRLTEILVSDECFGSLSPPLVTKKSFLTLTPGPSKYCLKVGVVTNTERKRDRKKVIDI